MEAWCLSTRDEAAKEIGGDHMKFEDWEVDKIEYMDYTNE